jgi:hypothetical protein
MSDDAPLDPKGLIREAYRIEGIDAPMCRAVFLDWALSLPADADAAAETARHFALRRESDPDHPMTAVLREGVETAAPSQRRRARARRRGDDSE